MNGNICFNKRYVMDEAVLAMLICLRIEILLIRDVFDIVTIKKDSWQMC